MNPAYNSRNPVHRSPSRLRCCTGAWLVASLSLGSCADIGRDPRESWLVDTLVVDNLELIDREPELCAGKFQKMATGLYPFFRGTAGQFWRDVTTPGAPLWSPPPIGARGLDVALIGDPHLENVGTFLDPSGAIAMAFNDFDAATYGPWWADVRRLAASIGVAAEALGEYTDSAALGERAVRAAVTAYVERVEAADLPTQHVGPEGRIALDLSRRALRDGAAREELAEYSDVVDGVRSAFIGDVEAADPSGLFVDTTVPVDPATSELVERILVDAAPTMLDAPDDPVAFFEVLGVSRRLGAGVSSYPILRWYAVVQGDSSGRDDDRIVELKEAREAPTTWPAAWLNTRPWLNNAHRIVNAQRVSSDGVFVVPLLGYTQAGTVSFRVSERTKYQKDFSVMRCVEEFGAGDWGDDDLIEFAALAGRVLAEAHCSTHTLAGRHACREIAASLASDPGAERFAGDTVEFAARSVALIVGDFELFKHALSELGPTLGANAQPGF